MSADVIDLRLVRFARTLRRLAPSLGVQLIPELEPDAISFWHELPDRFSCGRDALEAMKLVGFEELPLRGPPPTRLSLPPPELPRPRRVEWTAPRYVPRPWPMVSVAYTEPEDQEE